MVTNAGDPWLILSFHGSSGSDSPALELKMRHFIMLREHTSSQIYQELKLNLMELFLRTIGGRDLP